MSGKNEIRLFGLNRAGVDGDLANDTVAAGGDTSITIASAINAGPGDRLRIAVTQPVTYRWDQAATDTAGELLPPNSVEFIDVPPGVTELHIHNRGSAQLVLSLSKVADAGALSP